MHKADSKPRADGPPGINVYRLRTLLEWSIRTLGENCTPPLDKSTVQRVEHNKGFTQDTLERLAQAFSKGLGVQIKYTDLFLPPELVDFPSLPDSVKRRIAESVQDAAAANSARGRVIGKHTLPAEIADYDLLPDNVKRRVAETIQDAAAAHKSRARPFKKTG